MKFYHKLKETELNLTDAVKRHSADKCICYKEVNGEPVYLGYYFPEHYDATKTYPTFVLIHGGGWQSHKIFADQTHWAGDYLGYLGRYYANQGFICVSIDYRMTKEEGQIEGYELIDNYEDCCDAMDYILSHAKEYGTDVNQMYLLGESAGGHLAGAVATFHYDRRYRFQKVFLINAITEMDNAWNKEVPEKSFHEKLIPLTFEEREKFLSPLYQADEELGEIILIHGEADRCVNPVHSEKFYEKMEQLGKPCDLHILEQTGHAFLLAEYTEFQTACKMAVEILNQYLLK